MAELYVMVLYDDLAIKTVTFDKIDTLPKEGVLAISLTTEPGVRNKLVKRVWARDSRRREGLVGDWWGYDYYAIVEVATSFYLDQWDDDDERVSIRFVGNPHILNRTMKRPPRHPEGHTVHKFVGAYVDPTNWKIALAKFEAEVY